MMKFDNSNHPIPDGVLSDYTEQEKAEFANEWADDLAKCEHKTSAVLADEGTVEISSCTWGCGEILVTVTGDDGISHMMTVKELIELASGRVR